MKILRKVVLIFTVLLTVISLTSCGSLETASISYTNEYVVLYSPSEGTNIISVTLTTADGTEVSIERVVDMVANEQIVLYVSDLDSTQFDSSATIISATIDDSQLQTAYDDGLNTGILVGIVIAFSIAVVFACIFMLLVMFS